MHLGDQGDQTIEVIGASHAIYNRRDRSHQCDDTIAAVEATEAIDCWKRLGGRRHRGDGCDRGNQCDVMIAEATVGTLRSTRAIRSRRRGFGMRSSTRCDQGTVYASDANDAIDAFDASNAIEAFDTIDSACTKRDEMIDAKIAWATLQRSKRSIQRCDRPDRRNQGDRGNRGEEDGLCRRGFQADEAKWIGASVQEWQVQSSVRGIFASSTLERVAKLAEQFKTFELQGHRVARRDVRQFVGLTTWIACLMPQLQPFATMTWAALQCSSTPTMLGSQLPTP